MVLSRPAHQVSAGTTAIARWAVTWLRALDNVTFRPPKPPSNTRKLAGGGGGGGLESKLVGGGQPLTAGDLARHQRQFAGAVIDPFQLPLPGEDPTARDSDTSSTGRTDDDAAGAFASGSDDDGDDADGDESDEALIVHVLMEDTAFNAAAVRAWVHGWDGTQRRSKCLFLDGSMDVGGLGLVRVFVAVDSNVNPTQTHLRQDAEELDLLADLEREQAKLENDIRVARVGHIVESLGANFSRSAVQQVCVCVCVCVLSLIHI